MTKGKLLLVFSCNCYFMTALGHIMLGQLQPQASVPGWGLCVNTSAKCVLGCCCHALYKWSSKCSTGLRVASIIKWIDSALACGMPRGNCGPGEGGAEAWYFMLPLDEVCRQQRGERLLGNQLRPVAGAGNLDCVRSLFILGPEGPYALLYTKIVKSKLLIFLDRHLTLQYRSGLRWGLTLFHYR